MELFFFALHALGIMLKLTCLSQILMPASKNHVTTPYLWSMLWTSALQKVPLPPTSNLDPPQPWCTESLVRCASRGAPAVRGYPCLPRPSRTVYYSIITRSGLAHPGPRRVTAELGADPGAGGWTATKPTVHFGDAAVIFVTLASKINFAPNGGIFDASPKTTARHPMCLCINFQFKSTKCLFTNLKGPALSLLGSSWDLPGEPTINFKRT